MSTSFKSFLKESVNDSGIFKAIFVLGIPGAGKSYTTKKLSGQISPRMVNTDRAAEFLSSKMGKEISSHTWIEFKDQSTKITKNALSNYINGVLPLFIDGTSNDASNLLHRMGILESLGYDVGIIYVKTSLATAKARAKARAKEINRHVDEQFIESVFSKTEQNVQFLKSRVSFFQEIRNEDMELTDAVLSTAFKKTQGFFSAPLSNPIGQRLYDKMVEQKQKYLSPEIISKEILDKKIDGWYKT